MSRGWGVRDRNTWCAAKQVFPASSTLFLLGGTHPSHGMEFRVVDRVVCGARPACAIMHRPPWRAAASAWIDWCSWTTDREVNRR